MEASCIFCKIISKEIPTDFIKETENIVVIKDISPKAPIHYLIIPKRHFPDLTVVSQADKSLLGEIFLLAKQLSDEQSIKGFKLVVNNGKEVGQCVFHFHMHFLSGKTIKEV